MNRSLSVVPWLLASVVALIAYGSLYPFDFRGDAFEGGLSQALTSLSWQRAGRGDRISNVLLYLPLGFCLQLWLATRAGRAVSIIGALALSALLSFTIEIAQFFLSVRVPSLTDLVLNASGALLGALGGLAWNALSTMMHLPLRAEKPARDPAAALLIVLWLAWRFAPFVPQLDLGRLKSALRPLFEPQIEPATLFVYLTSWLVVNQAISALVSRARRLEALLIVIAAVLVGRLILANQAFVPSELLAIVLLLPLVVLMHRLRPAPRRTALVLAVAAVLLLQGLGPFNFTMPGSQFDFWPFRVLLDRGIADTLGSYEWVQLFAALFLYAALTWVLREWGAPMGVAVGVTVVLTAIIEILQVWLPGQHAGVTQPLIALATAWTMRGLDRRARRTRNRETIYPSGRNR